jgi:hypothetical protein
LKAISKEEVTVQETNFAEGVDGDEGNSRTLICPEYI